MKICKIYKSTITILLISFFSLWGASAIPDAKTSVVVETIFGSLKLEDELLEIYNLQHMQRLKNIDQSGTPAYWNKIPKFNRLDHSLDVLWLVKNFGGDLKEQIAALTHDISHTVFSHVADIVFGTPNYQDSIHEWFLTQTGIGKIIISNDWHEKDIVPDNPEFTRLEQPLPDMCADRIAYNLHTGLIFKKITKNDVEYILSKLRFEDGKWFFVSKKAALKFANLSLVFTEKFWGSADNQVVYHITALILKRAVMLERISKDDINFSTDKEILDKLNACDDPQIQRWIAKAKIPSAAYRILEEGEGTPDFVPKTKFRGIDPLIHSAGQHKRLSEIDSKFKDEYDRVKQLCEKGHKIQLNIS